MCNLDFIKYLKEKLPYFCENLTINLGDYDVEKEMITIDFIVSKKGHQGCVITKKILSNKIDNISYNILYQELIHGLICEYLQNVHFFERMVDSIFESIKKYNIKLVEFICKNCSNIEIEINYNNYGRNVITIRRIDKSTYFLEIDMKKNPQIYTWDGVSCEIEDYFKQLNQKGEQL